MTRPASSPNANRFRGIALATLRTLTRAGKSGVVRRIYGCVPLALRDRVRRTLLASAAGDTVVRPRPGDGRPARRQIPIPVPAPRPDGLGVNLIGFVHGELGLAENLRSLARALLSEGFPTDIVDVDILDASRNGDTADGLATAAEARQPVDVFFVNPDQLDEAMAATAAKRRDGTWRIGYWFWELPRVPESWMPAIAAVDEIWVASSFVAAAFQAVTTKPVTIVPMVVEPFVDAADVGSRPIFTFLFSFDFHSYPARKNPDAVIRAFAQAFPDKNEPVRLVIKTINGGVFREPFYALLSRARADARIEVQDGYMSRADMTALMADCDCYVSLHRSEGFGLGMAEAMALGRPVIATAYSGNLAFMHPDNSRLVPYSLVDVAPGEYMYATGQQWAEVDIDKAAEAMRSLATDRDLAKSMGRRAALDMAKRHSSAVSARAVIARLESLHLAPGPSEMNRHRSSGVNPDS